MKIRIKDNSIRFRLSQSEVAELGTNGVISGDTEFPGQTFTYALEKTEDRALSAVFAENRMVLRIPAPLAEEWITTDRIGFDGQDGKIKILVEKDFVCLDNTLEDQTDNYPNPNAKC